jgi:large subunit ribosomal protein L4e
MKASVLDIHGIEKEKIDLPKVFSETIRQHLVSKIVEAKKIQQPYSPSPVAGKQHSASGKIRHRRHVWQTSYGRGMSRIPRKVMSERGSQFNWVGAEVSSTVGGRRAHPPKILSMGNRRKINKKELKLALASAISATTNAKFISKKYSSLTENEIKKVPFIVDSKIISLKTKELLASVKKIVGEHLFKVALRGKSVRAGKGKSRGRKYKENAGLLIVVGEKEKIKASIFETANVKNLSVMHLADGGLGRLTIYTEKAVHELGERK